MKLLSLSQFYAPKFDYCIVAIGKARAACAQSFTPWQQATIEITCHDHSVNAGSRHIYMGVIVGAHSVRGESHIQRNVNGDVAIV